MSFSPIRKLEVWRTRQNGEQQRVGLLAQNRQGVFFQYDAAYLADGANLSPFGLAWSSALQRAPARPHSGLHGVFADCLPDGWGLLLMDRVFRQQGILPAQITAMDRLAFVGNRGMGALSYRPRSPYVAPPNDALLDLHDLGMQAQALFDGQTDEVLTALVAAGSSGGARPKVQVYFSSGDFRLCRARPQPGDEAWLVKFTSRNLALGHEEGLCEAAYLTLAKQAGLAVPNWQLLPAPAASGASHWLALQRFDWVTDEQGRPGRRHMHSACGLLDADFRMPSLDYEDLIKASSMLCRSPRAGQIQFRRAMFNLFALNQDDHSKNWAFLLDDAGNWSLAPFFDVTFSPHPFGEHATAFGGHGQRPPLKVVQKLASLANFANWAEARQVIQEVIDSLTDFGQVARTLGVSPETVELIEQQLNAARQANRHLWR